MRTSDTRIEGPSLTATNIPAARPDPRIATGLPRTEPVAWPRVSFAACLGLFVLTAAAQTAPSTGPSAPAPEQKLERVTVTGSTVRRTDTETPSPVQVLTADDIKKSGYTSVAEVLLNLTANNQGSLSQAAPGAFAAGGSGISLRGLTVGATLVLIDGHRMASYPMPDDGERDFVDISSIPMDVVERIEILKDGASAIYGSDAMAGVVNVILKKKIVGTTVSAEGGISSHGDGGTSHASITTGWGDLNADGHNAYISLETRHQNSIPLKSRPYLASANWSAYGGANLTQGTASGSVSGASSGAGSGTGYLTNAAGTPVYYYPGCTAAQAAADACGYGNAAMTLQPETTNLDLLGRFTTKLGDDWQINVQASLLNSKAHEVGQYNNAFNTGVGTGGNGNGHNLFAFGPGVGPTPAFPNNFPFMITVPSNYPGNATGAPAGLVYDFTDLGPLSQSTNSTSYRFVTELEGSLGGWDVSAAAGFTRVTTQLTLSNYIDFPNLQSALNDGSYIVGASNPASVLSYVAPSARSTSANNLSFVSLHGSRELMDLAGGPLQLGLGAEFTHRALNQHYPDSFTQGSQSIAIYSFASGTQSVSAAYAELVAPLTKKLEVDAAARVDHYANEGSSATPKVGLKYTPLQAFTLRGTFSRGFRAPNPAEQGTSGSTSGYVGGLYDPVNCPGGPSVPSNSSNSSCNIALQELQLPGKNLKPERSTSFTIGTIFEPSQSFNATLDYYHITIRDQIIAVGQLGQAQLTNAAALGTTIYRDASGNIIYDTYPFINANTTTTSGLELDVVNKFDLHEFGSIKSELDLSYMLQYTLTAGGSTYQLAGTHGPSFVSTDTGTPRTRASYTLTWAKGPLELRGTLNYVSGISVLDPSAGNTACSIALANTFPSSPPPAQFCHVPSFTELNLTGTYAFSKQLKFHAGVINALNRRAPFDLQTFGAAGNGAQQGGAPYNPGFSQEGAVGTVFTLGAVYSF